MAENCRRGAVCAESLDPDEVDNYTKKVIPKQPAVAKALKKAMNKNVYLKNLNPKDTEDLFDAMFPVKKKAGETIIEQGEEGDVFYIIETGDAEVIKDGKHLKNLSSGQGFGELALMYGTPRAATIKAKTDISLWGIDRLSYRHILMASQVANRKLFQSVLGKMDVFEKLDDYERLTIADSLVQRTYADKNVVIKQGDIGEEFFIVMEGRAVVSIKEGKKTSEVARYGPGDYFGELALLHKQPRAATVTAEGELICATMDRERFERILGPMAKILERKY